MSDRHSCDGCNSNEDCMEPVKGCGKCCSGGCHVSEVSITEDEKEFLLFFSQIPFLPLVRFKAPGSSANTQLMNLAPVYMIDGSESRDTIKKTGQVLKSLENRGLITLDYDKPLINGDYSIYNESQLFRQLCALATDRSPAIEYGSIALTPLGIEVLDSLDIM